VQEYVRRRMSFSFSSKIKINATKNIIVVLKKMKTTKNECHSTYFMLFSSTEDMGLQNKTKKVEGGTNDPPALTVACREMYNECLKKVSPSIVQFLQLLCKHGSVGSSLLTEYTGQEIGEDGFSIHSAAEFGEGQVGMSEIDQLALLWCSKCVVLGDDVLAQAAVIYTNALMGVLEKRALLVKSFLDAAKKQGLDDENQSHVTSVKDILNSTTVLMQTLYSANFPPQMTCSSLSQLHYRCLAHVLDILGTFISFACMYETACFFSRGSVHGSLHLLP
jgi:hypothetical protein